MSLEYINSKRNPFKNAQLLHTIEDIQLALHYPVSKVAGLIFERAGAVPHSNMSTWGLQAVVGVNKTYRLCKEIGLVEVPLEEAHTKLPLKIEASNTPLEGHEYAFLEATWCPALADDGDGNNILGGSGRFITSQKTLRLPLIIATPQRLAYYGAMLLHDSDIVCFDIPPYPVWCMSIGERYVDSCLLTPKGGGFYLEYHHDKPHFHMPLDVHATGFYLLAKEVPGGYHISAVRIPYGCAVYTSAGALHCDAGLIGKKWTVGYDISADFSKANMRYRSDDDDAMTTIEVYDVD